MVHPFLQQESIPGKRSSNRANSIIAGLAFVIKKKSTVHTQSAAIIQAYRQAAESAAFFFLTNSLQVCSIIEEHFDARGCRRI